MPRLGAAHMPYARSVASSQVTPISTLPDPGLVFDTLLKRDRQVEHPTGLSSMFFAFANLIIHSLFNTNRKDGSINDTSSYLDLSPLYGVDQKEQDRVRRFDGTGMLWDDVFADVRLLAMPPAIAALLIVFNRNHNVCISEPFAWNPHNISLHSLSRIAYLTSTNGVLISVISRQLTIRESEPRTTKYSTERDSSIGAFEFILEIYLIAYDVSLL